MGLCGDMQGPLPTHPDLLITDCRRVIAFQFFLSFRARFWTCLIALEKWAYFYPEYRGDFISLWNQSAVPLKHQAIGPDYFEQSILRQKYLSSTHSPSDSVQQEQSCSRPPTQVDVIPEITSTVGHRRLSSTRTLGLCRHRIYSVFDRIATGWLATEDWLRPRQSLAYYRCCSVVVWDSPLVSVPLRWDGSHGGE